MLQQISNFPNQNAVTQLQGYFGQQKVPQELPANWVTQLATQTGLSAEEIRAMYVGREKNFPTQAEFVEDFLRAQDARQTRLQTLLRDQVEVSEIKAPGQLQTALDQTAAYLTNQPQLIQSNNVSNDLTKYTSMDAELIQSLNPLHVPITTAQGKLLNLKQYGQSLDDKTQKEAVQYLRNSNKYRRAAKRFLNYLIRSQKSGRQVASDAIGKFIQSQTRVKRYEKLKDYAMGVSEPKTSIGEVVQPFVSHMQNVVTLPTNAAQPFPYNTISANPVTTSLAGIRGSTAGYNQLGQYLAQLAGRTFAVVEQGKQFLEQRQASAVRQIRSMLANRQKSPALQGVITQAINQSLEMNRELHEFWNMINTGNLPLYAKSVITDYVRSLVSGVGIGFSINEIRVALGNLRTAIQNQQIQGLEQFAPGNYTQDNDQQLWIDLGTASGIGRQYPGIQRRTRLLSLGYLGGQPQQGAAQQQAQVPQMSAVNVSNIAASNIQSQLDQRQPQNQLDESDQQEVMDIIDSIQDGSQPGDNLQIDESETDIRGVKKAGTKKISKSGKRTVPKKKGRGIDTTGLDIVQGKGTVRK